MKSLSRSSLAILILTLMPFGCSMTPDTAHSDPEQTSAREKPLVVFLVRHAEKVDSSDESELSALGVQRAADLARTLRSAGIEYVHSSDFVRTLRTAEPTAAEFGLVVELFDQYDLPAMAEKLRKTGGRHLVVGHSNTTPQLARLLSGTSEPVTEEEGEYGRLYIVTVWSDGKAESVVTHFGAAVIPEED